MLIATATTSFAIDKEQIKEAAKIMKGTKNHLYNKELIDTSGLLY